MNRFAAVRVRGKNTNAMRGLEILERLVEESVHHVTRRKRIYCLVEHVNDLLVQRPCPGESLSHQYSAPPQPHVLLTKAERQPAYNSPTSDQSSTESP